MLTLLCSLLSCKSMQPETAEQTQQPSQEELQKREALDFTRTKADIISYIRQYIPHVTDEQINKWTQDRLLEGKVVNGNFLYFKQAAPNLFRVCDTCRTIKEAKEGKETKKELEDVRLQIAEISNPLHKRGLFNPVRMRVTYTITVLPDAVPAGEEIRCWLPFPHKGIPRQKNIKLLSVNSQSYYINNQKERTHAYVFMRKKLLQSDQQSSPKNLNIPLMLNTSLWILQKSFPMINHLLFINNIHAKVSLILHIPHKFIS